MRSPQICALSLKKVKTSTSEYFSQSALAKFSGRGFSEKTLMSRISKVKLLTIKSLLTIVEPGHRAIKFNSITGVGETTYREGYNLKLPLLERPIIYDVRTHPKSIKSATGSKGKLTTLLTSVYTSTLLENHRMTLTHT